MAENSPRRRWISLGEVIGLAALTVSALGLYISWSSSQEDKPTRIVEQKQAIPLVLRGKIEDEGKALLITPVEPSHALELVTLNVPLSGTVIEIGSEGELSTRAIQSALNALDDREAPPHELRVRIQADYVEAGNERQTTSDYVITYRWEGGGLFGGRSLRFTGFRRA